MSALNADRTRRFIGLVDWVGRARARRHHGAFDQVGRGTIIAGRPDVTNDGWIQIGEECHLSSHPVQSHLLVTHDARVKIGSRVFISYGAAISAMSAIDIGDYTRIGPFCLILDNDFHKVGDRDAPGAVASIEIGRQVTIGARVTILRGARIGDGASVMSGSTVSGVIAKGAVVAGVPARVKGKETARKSGQAVAAIVMRVFGLSALPGSLDGPAQIPGWNSIGAVRLLLALEETYGMTLPGEQMREARSISEVYDLVTRARAGMRTALG
jgi:acetyltransferase-like isoleucine patch superfamily enzyme/acyl carrier protein